MDACDIIPPAEVEQYLGSVAPISTERLRIGSALMKAVPNYERLPKTEPVRSLRWGAGSSQASELFLVSSDKPFSARQNLVGLLELRRPPTDADLEHARAALARLREREGEDVDTWARQLSVDLGEAGE